MLDKKTKKTIKDVAIYVFILDIIAAAVMYFFFEDGLRLIFGLVFGSLITLLMFVELAITIQKAVNMEASKANAYTTSKYYLRFLIYGVVIFVSIKAPYINVIGTVIGLLSVKVIIYITHIIVKKKSIRKEE